MLFEGPVTAGLAGDNRFSRCKRDHSGGVNRSRQEIPSFLKCPCKGQIEAQRHLLTELATALMKGLWVEC